ncbi:MAG: hypothetical protein KKE37_14020 [Verrucomicrobia bacterium]|nr:hypothetical protein [Verrucomicrobiota bacterium]MBU4291435.1 hypothetical protein [Verrucomicrobiota bacterium]MBU4430453.1 hypothetical protein [Verrucomicrobiota bacterium]MCG2679570.1 hypothetical protein [Kiritimatiellia bacterium]
MKENTGRKGCHSEHSEESSLFSPCAEIPSTSSGQALHWTPDDKASA